MTDERQHPVNGEQAGDYDHNEQITVTVEDSVGAIFLGMLTLILLVALLRAQARNRKLAAQLLQHKTS